MKLKDLFITTFDPILLSRGFERKGRVYHRLVNSKIIQYLSYHSSSGEHCFTIQFDIEPLCIGGETDRCVDGLRLSDDLGVPDWEYEHIYGLERHMPDAVLQTEKHILSLFDSIVDYQSYLDYFPSCQYAPVPYGEDVRFLNLLLNSYEMYLESSETYMESWFESKEKYFSDHKKRYQKLWGHDYSWIPANRKMFEQEYDFYYRMKEALLANDREAVLNHIKDREHEMLSSYVKAFYSKSKYNLFVENGKLPFDVVMLSPKE